MRHCQSTAGRAWFAILFLAITCGLALGADYGGGTGQTPQSAVVLLQGGNPSELLKLESDWLKDHYDGAIIYSRTTQPTYRWTCDIVTFSTHGSRPMTAYFRVQGVQ